MLIPVALAGLLLSPPGGERPLSPGSSTMNERAYLEVSPAIARHYPPRSLARNFDLGVSLGFPVRGGQRFKASLGVAAEHALSPWLGDPGSGIARPAGKYAGTVPSTYQGQLFRLMPLVRIGAENETAFGYVGLMPGYALRLAPLTCRVSSCTKSLAVDQGLNFGVSIGAVLTPWSGLGVGAELALDSALFPRGHEMLARWNHGIAARALLGWHFQ